MFSLRPGLGREGLTSTDHIGTLYIIGLFYAITNLIHSSQKALEFYFDYTFNLEIIFFIISHR